MSTRYLHTNLVAKDWRRLSAFYQDLFDCTPVPPERDLSGEWLDKVTGFKGARINGEHLRLPGHGEDGPTIEIFQYGDMPDRPDIHPNTPCFAHIAFAVDDVPAMAQRVFDHGGAPVGESVVVDRPGLGRMTVQYVTDPEGNIIELQKLEEIA